MTGELLKFIIIGKNYLSPTPSHSWRSWYIYKHIYNLPIVCNAGAALFAFVCLQRLFTFQKARVGCQILLLWIFGYFFFRFLFWIFFQIFFQIFFSDFFLVETPLHVPESTCWLPNSPAMQHKADATAGPHICQIFLLITFISVRYWVKCTLQTFSPTFFTFSPLRPWPSEFMRHCTLSFGGATGNPRHEHFLDGFISIYSARIWYSQHLGPVTLKS